MDSKLLTPQTLDLEVRGLSLACGIVSLDKEPNSTLSLFTQVYKWVLATYCLGETKGAFHLSEPAGQICSFVNGTRQF